ncbi:hypothetical protein [Nocardioides convexus]|nr:hypothetical protein [Nocardioides convexus]
MTSTITEMMNAYPARIYTDREDVAACVAACVECAQSLYRVRRRLPQ